MIEIRESKLKKRKNKFELRQTNFDLSIANDLRKKIYGGNICSQPDIGERYHKDIEWKQRNVKSVGRYISHPGLYVQIASHGILSYLN